MKAKEYMDQGLLVPDEITNGIVRERLQQTIAKKDFSWMDFQELFRKRSAG